MTREQMIAAVEALGPDASLWERSDGTLEVTLQDFEGFDDDWSEVVSEYYDEDAVEGFLGMLDSECISKTGYYSTTYHFNGFDVELEYASSDI